MIELKDVGCKNRLWIEELAKSTNCRITKREYQSKYSTYVRYDYEPFCTAGFALNITVDGNRNDVGFFEYLYFGRKGFNWYLSRCLELEYKQAALVQ